MLFSIIIPHHTENIETFGQLLDSLNLQLGIQKSEFEVLVCNDVKEAAILDYSHWTNLNIRNLYLNSSGNPGLSRQLGIDHAKGDYLIFCDADDMLGNSLALSDIKGIVAQFTDNDIYIAPFLEEHNIDGYNTFQVHPQDFTWVFSKVYRRDFLITNNIRFSPKFAIHEDSYFNALCKGYNARIMELQGNFYIWRDNKESITRKDNAAYSYNSLCTFIDALEQAGIDLQERGIATIDLGVTEILLYLYMTLQDKRYKTDEAFKAFVPKIETRLTKILIKYNTEIENVDQELFDQMYMEEYNKCAILGEVRQIYETWEQFKNRLLSTYKE